MGAYCSSMFCAKQRSVRLLMVGLDGAGKTTSLYHLKLNNALSTIPTIGFNVETIDYNNVNFTVWDIGGQEAIRPLWRHYYRNAQGIIFVVDSNDVKRIDGGNDITDSNESRKSFYSMSSHPAKVELHNALQDEELRNVPLVVLANKQDLPNAVSINEMAERLGLPAMTDRKWHIIPTCAIKGEGLEIALDWMAENAQIRH